MGHADSFHRLMKIFVDSGEAATLADATAMFSQYGVRVVLGADVCNSETLQMIALTVINTASRSFQGNVEVQGPAGIELLVHGFEGVKLSEFAAWAGAKMNHVDSTSWPEICIGNTPEQASKNRISPWASGWVFGIGGEVNAGGDAFAPACVAAGALAVSEAFSILRKDSPYAGRRAVTFSLWSMRAGREQPPIGTSTELGDGLWLVGLGHLGQAYCWTMGMMRQQRSVKLILQDVDVITDSTLTTSVLSARSDVKCMKSRIVARWMEKRGFETRLLERRYDAATRVGLMEPRTALFGVDNPSARRMCEGAGFSMVLDAGLGSGYDDFRALRVRAFPGASSAAELWASDSTQGPIQLAAAYKALVEEGADPCGVTTLATRSVGAPFVGCYAAALVVAELLRRRNDERGHDVLDVNLRTPDRIVAV